MPFFLMLATMLNAQSETASPEEYRYYEKIKANYSRDVDHLINFKRDGLWIKEKLENKQRFIYAKKIENDYLNNITIIHLEALWTQLLVVNLLDIYTYIAKLHTTHLAPSLGCDALFTLP